MLSKVTAKNVEDVFWRHTVDPPYGQFHNVCVIYLRHLFSLRVLSNISVVCFFFFCKIISVCMLCLLLV